MRQSSPARPDPTPLSPRNPHNDISPQPPAWQSQQYQEAYNAPSSHQSPPSHTGDSYLQPVQPMQPMQPMQPKSSNSSPTLTLKPERAASIDSVDSRHHGLDTFPPFNLLPPSPVAPQPAAPFDVPAPASAPLGKDRTTESLLWVRSPLTSPLTEEILAARDALGDSESVAEAARMATTAAWPPSPPSGPPAGTVKAPSTVHTLNDPTFPRGGGMSIMYPTVSPSELATMAEEAEAAAVGDPHSRVRAQQSRQWKQAAEGLESLVREVMK